MKLKLNSIEFRFNFFFSDSVCVYMCVVVLKIFWEVLKKNFQSQTLISVNRLVLSLNIFKIFSLFNKICLLDHPFSMFKNPSIRQKKRRTKKLKDHKIFFMCFLNIKVLRRQIIFQFTKSSQWTQPHFVLFIIKKILKIYDNKFLLFSEMFNLKTPLTRDKNGKVEVLMNTFFYSSLLNIIVIAVVSLNNNKKKKHKEKV